MRPLKAALNLQYFTRGLDPRLAERVREAEAAGYESLWCAEAYGSDAFTPLAFLAAHTSRIRLGTAVAQIPARAPAAAAMAAMTLDHLSGGRAVLGLGVSGPQVAEGWYGQPYPRPLEREREYVEIVRRVIARDGPLSFDGSHYQLPSPGGTGLGKPLKSSLHPLHRDLPIYLGAEGPRNVALTAEIADGWLAMFLAPSQDARYRAALDEGFARRGGRPDGFEVVATVSVAIDDEIERAADRVRPMLALYIGGMGARGANFHADVFARMGYEAEVDRIQQRYLSGDRAGAVAAVPTRMVEEVALVGPAARIRDELQRWRATVVDTIAVQGIPVDLGAVAELIMA